MTMEMRRKPSLRVARATKEERDVLRQTHEGHENQEDRLFSSLAASAT